MGILRSPYQGPSRKLVLAFDIGTTYSGVSYTLLDPGLVPEIKSVGRFLNNHAIGSFKIPSILYYDYDGTFRGVKGTVDEDEAESLHQVRWWKWRLSPEELPAIMTADLPRGKSLLDIFSDFIRYLFDSARYFIKESEPCGDVLWATIERNINLILSHPRRWGGRELEFLRRAVVHASVLTAEEAITRISFITEEQATFNFLVTHTTSGELLKPRHKVIVIDAGDRTVDISAYTMKSVSPLEVEEFMEPQCSYQGAELVTARARAYAQGKFNQANFKNSRFDNEEDLTAFTESFDTGLKWVFSDSSKLQFVKFGSPRDNDPRCNVKTGKLRLPGNQVEDFFEPSVNAIVEGIKNIAVKIDPSNTFVFLTGSFSASPWIFQEVGRRIAAQGLQLSRPDVNTNKAVAVGSISYYLDHLLSGRLVRDTYGTLNSVEYDPSDPEHRNRSHRKYLGMSGEFQLDVFSSIVCTGMRAPDTREVRRIACTSPLPPVPGRVLEFPIIRYSGTSEKPRWMDEEEGSFRTISHISAEVGNDPSARTAGMSRLGFPSFAQELEVVCTFGQTEFKIQLSWMEWGTEKCSDAVVLSYDGEVRET